MGTKSKESQDAVRTYNGLKDGRGTWVGHWREVSRYVYPQADDFWQNRANSSHGEKKHQQVYDATAMHANSQFASLMESLTIPRNQRWHGLQITAPGMNRDRRVRQYMDQVTGELFRRRYASSANFQMQMSEAFMSIGAFGNGVVFVDDSMGTGLRYKSIFLGDFYFQLNFQGIMDTAFRRFDYTHHQAMQRFKEETPERVQKEFEREPYKTNEYLHVVMPNDSRDPDRLDAEGMRFRSMIIHLDSQEEVERSGYRKMPYAVGRYQTSPHELYGRGPAMSVLPDIRTLNEMARADLRATHKLVDPPLLVHDDGILGTGRQEILLDPGMLNFGGVSSDGRPLIQPLQTGARVDLNEAKMEVRRATIREAFLVNLFQILKETPRMTATEVLNRSQEKGALLGPIMGRIQSEMIGPIIDREIEILNEQGLLPVAPPNVREAIAEGDFEIIYESPLSRLQRSEQLVGIDLLIQMAVQLANIGQPEALDGINGVNIMRHVADGGGAPEDVIRSDKEVQEIQQQRAAQQQQQMAMEGAPGLAKATKDIAQAEQLQGL